MNDVMKETEAKLSELATTIDLHDRGVENGWRELLLSDIGREKMEHVRTLGEQLHRLRDERRSRSAGAASTRRCCSIASASRRWPR